MLLKQRIGALLILIVLLLCCGCSGGNKDRTYSETMADCVEVLKAREHSHKITFDLSVDGDINDGLKARYIAVARVTPDLMSVGFQTEKNQLISSYPNLIIEKDDAIFINLDRLYLLMEEIEAERLMSDTASLNGKYLRIKSGQDTGKLIETFDGFVSAWTILHDNSVSEIKNETDDGFLYRISPESIRACFEGISDNKEILIQSVEKYLDEMLGKELIELIGQYEAKSGANILVHKYEEILYPILEMFEIKAGTDAYEAVKEEFYIGSSDPCDNVSYKLSLLDGNGKSLLTFKLTVEHDNATPSISDISVEDVIDFDVFKESMALEVKDLISDNYESTDVWDGYMLGSDTLTLIRYGDAADLAAEITFSSGKITRYTETYKTKDIVMHEIIRHDALERGLSVSVNNTDGLASSGNYGILEMYTTDIYRILPTYASYTIPGEYLDYLISNGIIKEGAEIK